MKNLLLTSAFACAFAFAAHAETFTVTGSGQILNQVTATDGGRAVFGAYVTGTGNTVFASGKTTTSKNSCVQWSADPGSAFSSEGVCNNEDTQGAYSVLFSCETDAKASTSDCWGKLVGTKGSYLNKTGTASWHSSGSTEQKALTFAGTGQWN